MLGSLLMNRNGFHATRLTYLVSTLKKKTLILVLQPIFAARPGFEKREGCSSSTRSYLEPVPLDEKGLLPMDFILEDPDSHFIYICKKMEDSELR